jgi:hypothetical protein
MESRIAQVAQDGRDSCQDFDVGKHLLHPLFVGLHRLLQLLPLPPFNCELGLQYFTSLLQYKYKVCKNQ